MKILLQELARQCLILFLLIFILIKAFILETIFMVSFIKEIKRI
jgi:hypothetical protein